MYEIASRTLTLRTMPPREVTITVGLPYEEPTGEWSCPYRIDGLDGWEHERKVTGADAVEVVEMVLGVLRTAVANSPEGREGLLSWDEEPSGPRTVYLRMDQEVNAAYIAMKREIAPGEAVRQAVADDVVLDFSESGELLGVELLNADTALPSEMRA
ncbi:DUF2283 domain-containing protein [Nonomuraea endophytica]|uniref:Uncharacterized protein YuzE n=1 Tax=Nonomuraea endophytica TaxID=714136 RepID=A0A7W8EFR4_9ACTN|nr:DUF2283 domain-containing protein [Nonomuraea endophytica]MBB5077844.1 uncharacterized protein YuzE [Nonomuraea endophytica]